MTVVPSLILLMDKWTHRQELPLVVQLLTVVILATNCLVHCHALVELMARGLTLFHHVRVCLYAHFVDFMYIGVVIWLTMYTQKI